MLGSSTFQIYPLNPELRSDVPLWLKFRAFEYLGFGGRYVAAGGSIGNSSGGRDNGNVSFGAAPRLLTNIYVPAPKMLTSGVDNKFNESPVKTIFDSFEKYLGTMSSMAGFKGTNPVTLGINAVKQFSDLFYSLGGYFMDITPPDFNDNIYAGTSKRQFKFNLILPCLTNEDSIAALDICRTFEALSLPYTGPNALYFKHPPMWLFGVGPGVGPFIDYSWITDPQFCSLASVAVNRSAPEGGSYTLVTQYGLRPIVITVELRFVEIEPIYRLNGTTSLVSRSQAMVSMGSGLPEIPGLPI